MLHGRTQYRRLLLLLLLLLTVRAAAARSAFNGGGRRTRYCALRKEKKKTTRETIPPGARERTRDRLRARNGTERDGTVALLSGAQITYLFFFSLLNTLVHDLHDTHTHTRGLKLYTIIIYIYTYTYCVRRRSTYRTFACVEYFHFCENAVERHVVSVQQVYA